MYIELIRKGRASHVGMGFLNRQDGISHRVRD